MGMNSNFYFLDFQYVFSPTYMLHYLRMRYKINSQGIKDWSGGKEESQNSGSQRRRINPLELSRTPNAPGFGSIWELKLIGFMDQ